MNDERFGQIQIVELPPLRVACYSAFSSEPEEDAAEHLAAWRRTRGLTGAFRHFGFDTEVPAELDRDDVRGYEVWVTVPPEVEPSDDVSIHDFAGGTYASMLVRDPFDDPFSYIPAGWERLRTWVEESGHVAAGDHRWLEELTDEGLRLYHPVRVRVLEAGAV